MYTKKGLLPKKPLGVGKNMKKEMKQESIIPSA
jgi:hypothetical protein